MSKQNLNSCVFFPDNPGTRKVKNVRGKNKQNDETDARFRHKIRPDCPVLFVAAGKQPENGSNMKQQVRRPILPVQTKQSYFSRQRFQRVNRFPNNN